MFDTEKKSFWVRVELIEKKLNPQMLSSDALIRLRSRFVSA